MDDGIVTNQVAMSFTRKSAFDHLAGIAREWRTFALTAAATFGVWMSVEAPAHLMDTGLRNGTFYLGGLLASLAVSGVWTIRC